MLRIQPPRLLGRMLSMDQKPTLDSEGGEQPRAPRFLEKLNPKATWRSVARKALLFGLVAAPV